jgi:hypothetical protein
MNFNAANSTFRQLLGKRGTFASSGFRITQAVAEHYDVWDETKIEARQKQLATVATGVWKME